MSVHPWHIFLVNHQFFVDSLGVDHALAHCYTGVISSFAVCFGSVPLGICSLAGSHHILNTHSSHFVELHLNFFFVDTYDQVLWTHQYHVSVFPSKGELDWGEVGGWVRRSELCVREKPVCHLLRFTVSHLLRLVGRCAWIWVCKWGPHKFTKFLGI
jgi:hypothetical protein